MVDPLINFIDLWNRLFPTNHGQRGYDRGKKAAFEDAKNKTLNELIGLKHGCAVCKAFSDDDFDIGYFTGITEIIRRWKENDDG